jgi:hypothetical protein
MYKRIQSELRTAVKVYGVLGPGYLAIGLAFKGFESKVTGIGLEGIETDAYLGIGLKSLEQALPFIGLKYI